MDVTAQDDLDPDWTAVNTWLLRNSAGLAPLERLRRLEEAKRLLARAWSDRAATNPDFGRAISRRYEIHPQGVRRLVNARADSDSVSPVELSGREER